jgi:hypothetical protein
MRPAGESRDGAGALARVSGARLSYFIAGERADEAVSPWLALDAALAASAGPFAASSPSLVAASRHAVGEFAQIFSPVACALPIAAPIASPALLQIVGEVARAAE